MHETTCKVRPPPQATVRFQCVRKCCMSNLCGKNQEGFSQRNTKCDLEWGGECRGKNLERTMGGYTAIFCSNFIILLFFLLFGSGDDLTCGSQLTFAGIS